MTKHTLSALMLALAAPGIVSAQGVPAIDDTLDGVLLAQLSIHERVIIRMSRAMPVGRTPIASALAPPVIFSERKADKCVPLSDLTGAAVSQSGDVDLMVEGGKRLRAKLGEDCPALDFYSGFYLKPTADGRICAGRDAIRSRSGAVCPIVQFRKLVARR